MAQQITPQTLSPKINTTSSEKKKVGEILLSKSLITVEELQLAADESKKTGNYIGLVLIQQGKITKQQLGEALSEQHKYPYVDLSQEKLDKLNVTTFLPHEFIQEHKVVPLRVENGSMIVAMVDPANRRAIDEITFMTGMRAKPFVTTFIDYQEVMAELFGATSASSNLLQELSAVSKGDSPLGAASNEPNHMELDDNASPLVKLVNAVIEEAIERGASDIHIEPRKEGTTVRFRINGILQNMLQVPKAMESSFVTRLKVMGRMDIAEHRRPQDGRFAMNFKRTEYNFRVNCIPLSEGREKVVIRILRPSKSITDFHDLGMADNDIRKIEELYRSPYGIVLICGPTGSGKTTTLYTILHKINDDYRNISTVEDPIELTIEGLNQSQVNVKGEYTFASALRALLRQDPDIIMVGEIRDYDTLEAAIHASLTGHLVFSTIHANTTAATVTRLLEMGAEPSLVASALLGVVAQRLIRKLCDSCKQPYEASVGEKNMIFPEQPEKQREALTLYKPKGCPACNNTGYSGRIGLFEIMVLERKIKQLIGYKSMDLEIEDAAVSNGMKTLFASCREALVTGGSSLQEAIRVLGLSLGRNA